MSNTFGKIFRITTWGESHGNSIGVVIDGCPPGIEISLEFIQNELNRRRPGQSNITSPRNERDKAHLRSGVIDNISTGMPITLEIFNQDVDSSFYETIKDKWRPGHADFTYDMKYGIRDYRGSGRASGRETAARVAAGAVAKLILKRFHIDIFAFTRAIGNIIAQTIDRAEIERNDIRSPDPDATQKMIKLINDTKLKKDSVGGIVELRILGLPPGLGDPVFDKFHAVMAYAIMGIGAVRGIEIGDGFAVARSTGSQNNDVFEKKGNKIGTRTNHGGGVLGGITTGEDFILRAAIKPPPSIGIEQDTVDTKGNPAKIKIEGRHDPTVVPRIIPVVEAMAAIVTVDFLFQQEIIRSFKAIPS
jgi:chorismate synthase